MPKDKKNFTITETILMNGTILPLKKNSKKQKENCLMKCNNLLKNTDKFKKIDSITPPFFLFIVIENLIAQHKK